MSIGPFCVGLVVSTVNVAFLLRHIKYRTELCTYGYLKGNQPFSSKTPFTDSKDYRLVSLHNENEEEEEENKVEHEEDDETYSTLFL